MRRTRTDNALKERVQKLQEELNSLLTTGDAEGENVMELSKELDRLILEFYSRGRL